MTILKRWQKLVEPREDLHKDHRLATPEFVAHLDKVRRGKAQPVSARYASNTDEKHWVSGLVTRENGFGFQTGGNDMPKTQTFNTTDGKIGRLTANSVYFSAETEGDTSDPSSEPVVLYCVDAKNVTNGIEVGRFGSMSKAQEAADQLLAKNRSNPPTLKWE